MNGSRSLALASVPVAAGLAWQRYRTAVRALDAHPALAPDLPGRRRRISTRWGSVAYRWVEGDPQRPALVLVHGWGKTADSAWWPIIADCSRTIVAVDLPGHGHSQLVGEPFSFALAAEAVGRVVSDTGVERPVLVGHSMGGPVVLTTLRHSAAEFSGLVALATSAYWARPRLSVMMAMAPYAMAPRSPFLIHKERSELRDAPELAEHIAWAYSRRPDRRLLHETATALRRFDARGWTELLATPTTWVVAAQDGVLAPEHQRASARHFAATVVEVEAQHSIVTQAPAAVLGILETYGVGSPPT